jgi:hypothetical protein
MQWKDNRQENTISFERLSIGDVFVDMASDSIFIKTETHIGFDVCNDCSQEFDNKDQVEVRRATLVLD